MTDMDVQLNIPLNGILTHRISSNDSPQSDGDLKNTDRKKIFHYRQLYADLPDPIVFLPVAVIPVNTSGHLQDDFRLIFFHDHRESSDVSGESPEESDQFRFLRASCLADLKGSVGLISSKVSSMKVTIPIDLSTRSYIPLPRYFHSRRTPPLLNSSLVLFPSSLVLFPQRSA